MLKESYPTPLDFVKELQNILKNEPLIKGEGHEEFNRIKEERKKEYDNLINKNSIPDFRDFTVHIEMLFKYIKDSLDARDLALVNESIAFGVIDNTYCNALCIKSPDNKFAILLYEGLMLLLNKYQKLLTAAHFPEKVLSCNRGSPSDLKSEDYRNFANELIDNYKNWGAAYGAMVHIDLNMYANLGCYLILQELFVLCHELGHFFNGDLNDDNNFYYLSRYDWKIFDNNKDHLMELKADLRGFSLFEKAVRNIFKELQRNYLIDVICSLFLLLGLINSNPSSSHPAPLDRLMNILKYFVGEAESQEIFKKYRISANL